MTAPFESVTSAYLPADLAAMLFWSVNAVLVIVALHGLIVHRRGAPAYTCLAIWALTLLTYFAAPALTSVSLTLADSFFLLASLGLFCAGTFRLRLRHRRHSQNRQVQ